MRNKLKNHRGAAAVEFLFVLPILLFFLFGIVEFGLLLYNKAMITNASREGARVGITYTPKASVTDIENRVKAYCKENLMITFDSTPSEPKLDPPPVPCVNTGDELKVTVIYTYDFLMGSFFFPSLDLKGETVMRCE